MKSLLFSAALCSIATIVAGKNIIIDKKARIIIEPLPDAYSYVNPGEFYESNGHVYITPYHNISPMVKLNENGVKMKEIDLQFGGTNPNHPHQLLSTKCYHEEHGTYDSYVEYMHGINAGLLFIDNDYVGSDKMQIKILDTKTDQGRMLWQSNPLSIGTVHRLKVVVSNSKEYALVVMPEINRVVLTDGKTATEIELGQPTEETLVFPIGDDDFVIGNKASNANNKLLISEDGAIDATVTIPDFDVGVSSLHEIYDYYIQQYNYTTRLVTQHSDGSINSHEWNGQTYFVQSISAPIPKVRAIASNTENQGDDIFIFTNDKIYVVYHGSLTEMNIPSNMLPLASATVICPQRDGHMVPTTPQEGVCCLAEHKGANLASGSVFQQLCIVNAPWFLEDALTVFTTYKETDFRVPSIARNQITSPGQRYENKMKRNTIAAISRFEGYSFFLQPNVETGSLELWQWNEAQSQKKRVDGFKFGFDLNCFTGLWTQTDIRHEGNEIYFNGPSSTGIDCTTYRIRRASYSEDINGGSSGHDHGSDHGTGGNGSSDHDHGSDHGTGGNGSSEHDHGSDHGTGGNGSSEHDHGSDHDHGSNNGDISFVGGSTTVQGLGTVEIAFFSFISFMLIVVAILGIVIIKRQRSSNEIAFASNNAMFDGVPKTNDQLAYAETI